MFSNQNLQSNGAAITNMTIAPISGDNLIKAQQGYYDSSIMLESLVQLDPMKNMIMLQTAWDKQVMQKSAFSSSIYKRVVNNNQVLEVNGQDGGFKYKMAVETDNCMRTVEDTSSQSADGYLGGDGTTFKIVLNRKLSPFQTLSCDKAYGSFLSVADQEVEALAHGYVHYVKLMGSEQDKLKLYSASLLRADVVYTVTSNSYIAEYSEKLGIPHVPAKTNYIESEFKLGAGQGSESWFTGKADSYKLQSGYTTADTQTYLQELSKLGLENSNLAVVRTESANGKIDSVADISRILTMRSFTDRFNSSLMFMQGAKVSNGAKGSLEFNEGLWQQMRRGKIFTYNRKGGIELADLQAVRNYVFLNNDSRVEDTFLKIEAGTELYDNIKRIIQQNAIGQINNLANLLGADRVTEQRIVTGPLDALRVARVQFADAEIPGIGRLSVVEDKTLNYLDEGTDIRRRGINPKGYDHTTYSGYVWNVQDQFYSNNAVLPEGTRAVGGEARAQHNVYLVRPEKNALVWGTTNGRYSSKTARDIVASSNIMGEGFWIYGFGAMWMPDPSKFVMIELKNRHAGIR